MGDLQTVLVLSLIATAACWSFERAMPDVGGPPIMGTVSIVVGVVLMVVAATHGDWSLLGVAAPFVIAGILCKMLDACFPRWSQTPEGKMRLAAERENRERDQLRRLQEKYDA